MMKKGWLVLLVCVSFVSLFFVDGRAVAAGSGKVISGKNEYGGKTVETVYAGKNVKEAKKGRIRMAMSPQEKIQKDITYFDGKGKKVKVESFYSPQYTASSGAERRIAFFSANGELTKMEKYFPASYAAARGFDRTVVYYDMKNKRTKTEYYKDSKLVKPK
ncbi:MAG: hypothetical protein M0024_09440 [Nitrospiraceae bacterium]|nr:hypothetical protein [Nitrospiraceae bacterium]